MTNVLVVTWNGGGNVDPTIGVAQRLLDDGARVAAVGPPSLVDRFGAAGVVLTPRDPRREWDQAAMAADVADALARERPNVALVDFMMPGALCATEAAGVATVALVHTLYRGAGVRSGTSPMGMAATVAGINAVRTELGLGAVPSFGDLLDATAVALVTAPGELDAGPGPVGANVRYVGPVFERVDTDHGEVSGCDVVVSLGTTDMGERAVLERVLAALAGEPVTVVATVGDHLDPAAVAAPPNASVHGRIPHAAIVPGAAVVVCHGGLGTILAALRHGVPVLCIPLGRDQHANAAAVVSAGVGRSLAMDASPAAIRAAVRAVTSDATMRAAATQIAAAVTEDGRHPAIEAVLEVARA